MKRFIAKLIGPACVGVIAVCSFTSSEAVSYQDDFGDAEKSPGASLNGSRVGTSSVFWEATPNVRIADGYSLKVDDQGPFVCRVAVPIDVKGISRSAKINPTSPAGGRQAWVGLGIGDGVLGNPNFDGLLLVVYSSGIYNLLYNPEKGDGTSSKAVSIQQGRLRTWNPDGMNRLLLVYDEKGGTVSVQVNENEEVVSGLSLEKLGYTLRCRYAGVSGFGQASNVRSVSDFSLTFEE